MMKVAIVHYWLISMRGGEKVLESLLRLYPDADIYTHVADRKALSPLLAKARIHETFIARMPWARRKYQAYLPLMPLALEQLDLVDYDLVISCESGPAKGVITRPDAIHVCYCHSPMRYVWDMYHDYTRGAGVLKKALMAVLLHYMRFWDQSSAARPDHIVANSGYIAKRVRKSWRRESVVINPPVELDAFHISAEQDDYYLCLGQLVSYKRVDIAVRAFNASGRRLIVVGEGEELESLRKIAGPNVEMKGKVPFAEIVELYARCRALVFPGVEDFGIVPLEAMASGRPVIAYGKGGVIDSVLPGVTGIFFDEQSPEALNGAVDAYEAAPERFVPDVLRAHAAGFSREKFESRLKAYLDGVMSAGADIQGAS